MWGYSIDDPSAQYARSSTCIGYLIGPYTKTNKKYIIWHLNWDIHLNTLPYSERNKIMAFVDWAVGYGVGDGQILHCLHPVDLGIILFYFYVQ